jgi:MerR family redox-sensitive transcriptional activator SoxR
METLSIGIVAVRLGIRQSAIRYYEDEGLVKTARRNGGARIFDPAAMARLQVIHTARELGFSLDEIRQLLVEFPADMPPPERWRELAREKLPAIDDQIRRAMALRLMLVAGMGCQCVRIEDCFLDGCEPASTKTKRALPIVPPAG